MTAVGQELPLAGVRVLDFARGALGAAARLLGELGADVVRVHSPTGDPDQSSGPRAGGISLDWATANASKRSVALAWETENGQAALSALAAKADILIESFHPGTKEAALLDAPGLRARLPELVILSLPDFGEGAFAHWKASDGVIHALSGLLARSGVPGREPVIPPGQLMLQCSAHHAAYAAMAGYYNRLRNGVGDRIEVAVLDAGTQSLDPGYGIAGSASAGVPASMAPRGRPAAAHMYPVFRCADGFIRFCILAARQWDGLFEWMGRPEQFASPDYRNLRFRQACTEILPAIGRFVANKTRADIEREAGRHGFPAAGLLTFGEVIKSDHMRHCDALVPAPMAPGMDALFSNGIVSIDGVRAGFKSPPPRSDVDFAKLLAEWSVPTPARVEIAVGDPQRPLAGLRVLDLGIIVVGSEAGRLLLDLGADVIKVENRAFVDGSRASSPTLMSLTFAAGHRNKRSLGLNLRSPEGREMLLQMVEKSDVVLTNFKPGTLQSLGISPEVLMSRNPRLIVTESSAFGNDGPWGDRMGYGPLVRATAGLTEAWVYPDDPAAFSDAATSYPDHIAARVGIVGVLALLVRRLRTGRGGVVGISQIEVMLSHFGPRVAALSLREQGIAIEGGPLSGAPNGVYACAGDDDWCVVSARDSGEWKALCGVIGGDDLASNSELETPEGRVAASKRIDAAIAQWTCTRPAREVMEQMQSAGVPAGMMLRVAELPDFAYFQERRFFDTLVQDHLDRPVVIDNLPFSSEVIARPPVTAAPMLGEHTREVACEVLSLAHTEVDRLLAAGVLEQFVADQPAATLQ